MRGAGAVKAKQDFRAIGEHVCCWALRVGGPNTVLVSTQHRSKPLFPCSFLVFQVYLLTRIYCYSQKSMLSLAAGRDFEISEQCKVLQNSTFVHKEGLQTSGRGEKQKKKNFCWEK